MAEVVACAALESSTKLLPLHPPSIRVNHRGGGKARRECDEELVGIGNVKECERGELGEVGRG